MSYSFFGQRGRVFGVKPLRIIGVAVLALFLAACDHDDKKSSSSSSGGSSGGQTSTPLSKVSLNAFKNFNCTSNWTNRDGGLGLRAGTGSGTCKATFPGRAGNYRMRVNLQTEFDGSSPYRVSLNGRVIHSGRYPYSTGKLVCDCPNWRQNCPDRIVSVDLGVRALKPGDVIEFYGAEVYPCGEHGSYAKWRGMDMTP